MATIVEPMLYDANANINDDSVFEYDVGKGSCYVYCCFSMMSYGLFLPCYCIAYKMVSSQQARIINNKLNFRLDCWVWKTDQMVPLDRIQDVGINQNCCHRCCGVSELTVQTAGGGERPEIMMTAVKNPQRVRDYILQCRDEVANMSNGTDGTASVNSVLKAANNTKEVTAMNDTLSRIEKLIQQGLQSYGAIGVQTKDKIHDHEDSESSNLLH